MDLPALVPNEEFGVAATRERMERARDALNRHNLATEIVPDSAAATAAVLALLPEGAEVHVALSETMKLIGVTDAVEQEGRFNAIRPRLKALNRETQKREMAKLATAPDYMLGSVHAVTEDGQLVIGSGTGSQLAPYASGAGMVILVAGAQKVVKDIAEGLQRVREYSLPMEDARMKSLGRAGSLLAQVLIMSYAMPGRVHLFLVEESIGY